MRRRFALVKDGVVQRVLVADEDFFEKADPQWRRTFDEVVPCHDEVEPVEPGSSYTKGTFTRAPREDNEAEDVAARDDDSNATTRADAQDMLTRLKRIEARLAVLDRNNIPK